MLIDFPSIYLPLVRGLPMIFRWFSQPKAADFKSQLGLECPGPQSDVESASARRPAWQGEDLIEMGL